MVSKFIRIMIAVVVAMAALLSSCCNTPEAKLEAARQLIDEHPDSAYRLLREVDCADFKTDSLRAKFILTKALVNTKIGRTLITDSLLTDAVRFYYEAGDTVNWVAAAQSMAGYNFLKGDIGEAMNIIDGLIARIHNPYLLREAHSHRLEFSWAAQDYPRVYVHADWLLNHTDKPERILRFGVLKSVALYMQRQFNAAVVVCDSIIATSVHHKVDEPTRASFYCDYAEMLDCAGRSAEAIDVLQKVIDESGPTQDVEKVSRKMSMAQFYANNGDAAKAMALLDSINHEATISIFEAYVSIAMLKVALQYKQTGHFPSEFMHHVTKAVDLNHRLAQYDRETALESVMELNEDKYELQLQKQRLWIFVIGIALVLVVGGIIVYIVLSGRKRRLIEAEERAETLEWMLKDAEKVERDSSNSSDNSKLKAALFRQLGILKTFAGVPTQQSRDALKRISGAKGGDESIEALVDWTELYSMIDELYDNFHSKLIKTHPDIFNGKEQQIIVLLKSGFSTKEIGVLTEQSSATIYVRKTAIRKKLRTPENGDFIAQLDAEFAHSSDL